MRNDRSARHAARPAAARSEDDALIDLEFDPDVDAGGKRRRKCEVSPSPLPAYG